jgi:hypothetical protein
MELNFSQTLMVDGVAGFYTRPGTVILFAISIAATPIQFLSAGGGVKNNGGEDPCAPPDAGGDRYGRYTEYIGPVRS